MADRDGVTSLARAFAPGLVQFQGRRYLIEPPRVWHALTLLGVTGAGAGQDASSLGWGDAALVRRVLRDWWPERLASAACAPEQSLQPALLLVRRLILTRTQEDREALKEERSTKADESLDWDGLVSDYMARYGLAFREVMEEPWPAFLSLARYEGRQRARTWLTYLKAKSAPHVKDERERTRLLDGLREQAGYPTSFEQRKARQPQTWEEQKKVLESLDQYAPPAGQA